MNVGEVSKSRLFSFFFIERVTKETSLASFSKFSRDAENCRESYLFFSLSFVLKQKKNFQKLGYYFECHIEQDFTS